jgi:hypothetical protein
MKAIATIVMVLIALSGALLWFMGEEWQKTYRNDIFVNGVYLGIIFLLIWLLLKRPQHDFMGLPKIKAFVADNILLVEHTPWLSYGTMIGIYMVVNNYERFVCVGEVINIQSNGLVQIRTEQDDRGYSSEEETTKALNEIDKKLIIIKPALFPRGS